MVPLCLLGTKIPDRFDLYIRATEPSLRILQRTGHHSRRPQRQCRQVQQRLLSGRTSNRGRRLLSLLRLLDPIASRRLHIPQQPEGCTLPSEKAVAAVRLLPALLRDRRVYGARKTLGNEVSIGLPLRRAGCKGNIPSWLLSKTADHKAGASELCILDATQ